MKIRAIFLDRDGVINHDSPDYILSPDEWQPIPGSLDAIARLSRAGIPLAVCSNQSALGRCMLDADTFSRIDLKMHLAITAAGGNLAYVAYCPHAPEANCNCRKPKPGLVLESLDALDMDAGSDVLMIGDSVRDVEAALAAGIRPLLVLSGYGDPDKISTKARALLPDLAIYPILAAAVTALLAGDA